jgi:hypothetical protein
MKFQDGFIDIDLDGSTACLWSVAVVAFLVGEVGEDLAFESYHEEDAEIYLMSFKDLNEYKRRVVSGYLEDEIGGQQLDAVTFRIKRSLVK